MNTTKSYISTASYHDIHLAHRHMDTVSVVDRLKSDIIADDESAINGLDILFFPGDIIDRHLSAYHPDISAIISFIIWVVNYCKKRGIELRFLEGTPSHDWKQLGTMLMGILDNIPDHTCRWVHELSIEHLPGLDITILYIPDECHATPEDTWVEILKLLSDDGLAKVDIICMHGQFEYQLPPGVSAHFHDIDKMLSIVNMVIYAGHIHQRSTVSKLEVAGSYDRTAHGDESPKGHLRGKLYYSGSSEHTFVLNENAKIFKTIDVSGLHINEALICIDKEVSALPPSSHVRIHCLLKDRGYFDNCEIVTKYPSFVWKVETTDKAAPRVESTADEYVSIPITPDTIHGLISDLGTSRGIATDKMAMVLAELDDLCKGV